AAWPALERCLPDGVKMTDYVETDAFGVRVSVGRKLARLGAIPTPGGKLYDILGREIAFFRHYDGGPNPGGEFLRPAAERLRQVKERCPGIEIRRDPVVGCAL